MRKLTYNKNTSRNIFVRFIIIYSLVRHFFQLTIYPFFINNNIFRSIYELYSPFYIDISSVLIALLFSIFLLYIFSFDLNKFSANWERKKSPFLSYFLKIVLTFIPLTLIFIRVFNLIDFTYRVSGVEMSSRPLYQLLIIAIIESLYPLIIISQCCLHNKDKSKKLIQVLLLFSIFITNTGLNSTLRFLLATIFVTFCSIKFDYKKIKSFFNNYKIKKKFLFILVNILIIFSILTFNIQSLVNKGFEMKQAEEVSLRSLIPWLVVRFNVDNISLSVHSSNKDLKCIESHSQFFSSLKLTGFRIQKLLYKFSLKGQKPLNEPQSTARMNLMAFRDCGDVLDIGIMEGASITINTAVIRTLKEFNLFGIIYFPIIWYFIIMLFWFITGRYFVHIFTLYSLPAHLIASGGALSTVLSFDNLFSISPALLTIFLFILFRPLVISPYK